MIKFYYLGKCSITQEKIDIKRRYIECIEKLQLADSSPNSTSTKPTDPTDVELDGFCSLIKSHLKTLPRQIRIKAQKDMFDVVTEAVQNDI